MKYFTMIGVVAALSLSGCQTTQSPGPAGTPPPAQPTGANSTAAINAAVDACLSYVETGVFDPAALLRAGFRTGRSVTGPNYTQAIGATTLDRLNASAVTVAPRRAPGCALNINGAGGTFAAATNTINQRIIAAGWTYAPEGRKRSYTKGAQRMDMAGSAFNALKSYNLSLR